MSDFRRCVECGNWFKPTGISNTCPHCRRRRTNESMLDSERGTAWGHAYRSIDSDDWNIFTIIPKLIVKGVHFNNVRKSAGGSGSDDSKSSSGCGCGCLLIVIVMAILAAIGGLSEKKDGSETAISQTSSISTKAAPKPKIPAYLKAVENINNNKDLAALYFDIANKFYYNEMGLKGSQEQIEAGNKLMLRVYDFLGTSARKGYLMDVDSMKSIIHSYSQVSDFRKKKAVEELQLGVDKIESLND